MIEYHAATADEREQFQQLLRDHVVAHLRKDAPGAASVFTDDILLVSSPGYELAGREAVVARYEQMYAETPILDCVYGIDELVIADEVAHQLGVYTLTTEVDGHEVTGQTRYWAVWARDDVGWKVHRVSQFPISQA